MAQDTAIREVSKCMEDTAQVTETSKALTNQPGKSVEDMAQDPATRGDGKSMEDMAQVTATSADTSADINLGTNIQDRMETNKEELKPMESKPLQKTSTTKETTKREKLRGKPTRITRHRKITQNQATQGSRNTHYPQVTWMPWKRTPPPGDILQLASHT